MPILIDSYSEANKDASSGIGNSGGNKGVGESFTGTGAILTSAVFFLAQSGSPTGNATAKIYAHSGVFGTSSVPTGSPLATSDNFDVSILTGTFALSTFNFSGANQIALTSGTNYVLTVEYASGAAATISVGRDGSSPSYAGNFSFQLSGGSWTASATSDTCFYLYGDLPVNTAWLRA